MFIPEVSEPGLPPNYIWTEIDLGFSSPSDAEQLFSFLSPRVGWILSAADPQSSLSAVDISVADDVIGA
jgi:hypothetical protein